MREALAFVREAHCPELVEPESLAAVRRWLARGAISAHHAARAVRELGAPA